MNLLRMDFSQNYNDKWTLAAEGPNCIFFTDYHARKKKIAEAKAAAEAAETTPSQTELVDLISDICWVTIMLPNRYKNSVTQQICYPTGMHPTYIKVLSNIYITPKLGNMEKSGYICWVTLYICWVIFDIYLQCLLDSKYRG